MLMVKRAGRREGWQVTVADPHSGQVGTFFGQTLRELLARARAWLDLRRAVAACAALERAETGGAATAADYQAADQAVAAMIASAGSLTPADVHGISRTAAARVLPALPVECRPLARLAP